MEAPFVNCGLMPVCWRPACCMHRPCHRVNHTHRARHEAGGSPHIWHESTPGRRGVETHGEIAQSRAPSTVVSFNNMDMGPTVNSRARAQQARSQGNTNVQGLGPLRTRVIYKCNLGTLSLFRGRSGVSERPLVSGLELPGEGADLGR